MSTSEEEPELVELESLEDVGLADDVVDAAASVALELELEVELASCRGAKAAALAVEARTAAKRAEAVSENFILMEVTLWWIARHSAKEMLPFLIYTCRPPPTPAHVIPCLNSHRGSHCSAACAVLQGPSPMLGVCSQG
jgi:hypothetical protein